MRVVCRSSSNSHSDGNEIDPETRKYMKMNNKMMRYRVIVIVIVIRFHLPSSTYSLFTCKRTINLSMCSVHTAQGRIYIQKLIVWARPHLRTDDRNSNFNISVSDFRMINQNLSRPNSWFCIFWPLHYFRTILLRGSSADRAHFSGCMRICSQGIMQSCHDWEIRVRTKLLLLLIVNIITHTEQVSTGIGVALWFSPSSSHRLTNRRS